MLRTGSYLNPKTVSKGNINSKHTGFHLQLSDQITGVTLPSLKRRKVLHKKETKLPGKLPRTVGLQPRKTYKRPAKNLKERELYGSWQLRNDTR